MRPRRPNPAGGLLGLVVGGLAGGPAGAAIGGLAGAALSNDPYPLEEALEKLFRGQGLDLVRIYRLAPTRIDLLFRAPPAMSFWTLKVEVRAPQATNPQEFASKLDDNLYDGTLEELLKWRKSH